MAECDFYAWIPAGSDLQNHRLSLRKNLITKNFEVYRAYQQRTVSIRRSLFVEQNTPNGNVDVAFKSRDFGEALRWANNEYKKYHKESRSDEVCDHDHRAAFLCPVVRGP